MSDQLPSRTWAEGPAGDVGANSRAPWGAMPLTPAQLLYRTHGCCPGQEWQGTVYRNEWGDSAPGCYPPICEADGSIPAGIRFARGVTPACIPRPPGWDPRWGCWGFSSGTSGNAPPPAGWQPQSIAPSPQAGLPAQPQPIPLPQFNGAALATPDASDPLPAPPRGFGTSKYPLASPPSSTFPGAPDYLYITIGNRLPLQSTAPELIPEAPVGYTMVRMIPFGEYPHWDLLYESQPTGPFYSFVFQYIDKRLEVPSQDSSPPASSGQLPPPSESENHAPERCPPLPISGTLPSNASIPIPGAELKWTEFPVAGTRVGFILTSTFDLYGPKADQFWGVRCWFRVRPVSTLTSAESARKRRFGFFQCITEALLVLPWPPLPGDFETLSTRMHGNDVDRAHQPDDGFTGIGWYIHQRELEPSGQLMWDAPGVPIVAKSRNETDENPPTDKPGFDYDLVRVRDQFAKLLRPRQFPKGIPVGTTSVSLLQHFSTHVIDITNPAAQRRLGAFLWSVSLKLHIGSNGALSVAKPDTGTPTWWGAS